MLDANLDRSGQAGLGPDKAGQGHTMCAGERQAQACFCRHRLSLAGVMEGPGCMPGMMTAIKRGSTACCDSHYEKQSQCTGDSELKYPAHVPDSWSASSLPASLNCLLSKERHEQTVDGSCHGLPGCSGLGAQQTGDAEQGLMQGHAPHSMHELDGQHHVQEVAGSSSWRDWPPWLGCPADW